MKRFFERVREKGCDAAQPPVLIVAFGDSVTQGAMALGKWDPESVYHRKFQQELESVFPSTTFSTINAGVGGSSARQSIARVPRDILRHQPDLVLIAFGLNDCGGGSEALPDFAAALGEIIHAVRTETEADIILLTPPHMATKRTGSVHVDHVGVVDGFIQSQNNGTLALYAEVIRQVAREEVIALADIHAEWTRLRASGVDTNSWLSNGINHPDTQGHRLAATTLFTTLFSLRDPQP